jgi:hypothetical protein
MKRLIPTLLLLLCANSAYAQVNALSCSQTDMNSAFATARAGQAVNVPAGNCTRATNAVSLSKAITLNGAGQGA